MPQAGQALTTDRSLSLADLNTSVNHEPRIQDDRLAEALGFPRLRKIKDLIARHIEALQRFGEVCTTAGQTSERGGRPGKVYWLNKRQCLYLCTKSETANASEVTIQMVEVFDAYLKGEVKPVRVKEHQRSPARRRARPGFGTVIANHDHLYPFIQRGDELMVEFCSRAHLDVTEPAALFVLLNPATRDAEPFWIEREAVMPGAAPAEGALRARDLSGMPRWFTAAWPVIGRVIGINKPTTRERELVLHH